MPGEKPTAEVRLKRRGADLSYYFEVLVSSVVKPGLKNKGIIEWERSNQEQQVGVLAGALAEEFCEKYSDTIDPSEAAAAAQRAYIQLMSAQDVQFQLGDDLPRAADREITTRAGVARH